MRREAIAAVALFVLAAAVRLAVIAQLQDEALFRSPQLDGLEYLNWASRIAQGDFSWPEAPIHGPGYPFFTAAVLAISGSLAAVHYVQALLGAVSALFVFLIARREFALLAAIVGGALYALCAPLVLIEVSILAEGLFIALLMASLWSERWPIASGALLGLAIVVRPTAAILVPLFGWLYFRRERRHVVAFVVAAAIPVIPVVWNNASTRDSALAVQTSAGMNFYIGNSPLHDGTAWARPGGKWDATRGMAWRQGIRGAAREDRFFVKQTLREIASDPLAFLKVLASKVFWLTQDEELRDTHSFHFFARSSPLLRWLPGFGVVFALGVIGIVAAGRRSPLLLGYAVLMSLTVIALVAGSRYRAPLIPVLCIFAGAAIAWAATRKPVVIAVAFVVLVALTHIRHHPPSHEFSEETAMTALSLKNEGRIALAIRTARRAVAMNPKNSAAWVALGDIEGERGDFARAEHAWGQAIAVDPNNARAWSHMALAHIRRDDAARAHDALQRAVAIRPDAEALHNLQVLREALGARVSSPAHQGAGEDTRPPNVSK